MEHLGVDVNRLSVNLVGPAGVVADALDDGTDVAAGHGDGLAVVERLDGGNEVGVLLNNVGELHKHDGTAVRRDLGPLALKGLAGGLDGNVDILLGTLADRGDDLLGGGVDDLELLLVGALDPLVVDEAAEGRYMSVAALTGDCLGVGLTGQWAACTTR